MTSKQEVSLKMYMGAWAGLVLLGFAEDMTIKIVLVICAVILFFISFILQRR